MALPDRRALELAGGLEVAVAIVPTAAAPDHNHRRAGENGRAWFASLGARHARVAPVIDARSAADPQIVADLENARLIFLLGGYPGYLAETLAGSPAWQAIQQARQAGAVVAGSSAGAMVLCEQYFDPRQGRLRPGLNWLPGVCLLPHHNTFGQDWAARLGEALPGYTLVGIDEFTGILGAGPQDAWTVYGGGMAHTYRQGRVEHYRAGERLKI
jgi:cyanophycinase